MADGLSAADGFGDQLAGAAIDQGEVLVRNAIKVGDAQTAKQTAGK